MCCMKGHITILFTMKDRSDHKRVESNRNQQDNTQAADAHKWIRFQSAKTSYINIPQIYLVWNKHVDNVLICVYVLPLTLSLSVCSCSVNTCTLGVLVLAMYVVVLE